MISLEQLVKKINSRTFNPAEIPSADVFLAKYNDKTLIEHLIQYYSIKLIDQAPLIKQTFERFNVLMQQQKNLLNTYTLAKIKYMRLVCRAIIINPERNLDQIARMNNTLTDFFPEDNPRLHEILIRDSYRIIIGRILGDISTIRTIYNSQGAIQHIRMMAKHPLYSTNRNEALKRMNELTSTATSYFSGMSMFNSEMFSSLVSPLVTQYDQLTSTQRSLDLAKYAQAFNMLHAPGSDVAHIDLLSFLYFEGNEALQKEIVDRIDSIIEHHPANTALHAHILETFAPEPLGKMAYAMHAHSSNILSALKSESYLKLFRACPYLLKEDEDVKYFNLGLDKVINAFHPFTEEFSFHSSTPASTRWLAYLMCMGVVPKIEKIYINADDVSMDDQMLISYLMCCSKLVLSSSNHQTLAVVSTLPIQCIITGDTNEPAPTAPTQKYTDEEICALLKNREIFEKEDTSHFYHLRTSNNIDIGFVLNKTSVITRTINFDNKEACLELLRLLIKAFPEQWEQLSIQTDEWRRPCAVRVHDNINLLHCSMMNRTHPYPQWVIVHDDHDHFLFDLNISPGLVEKGIFSCQGYGSQAKLKEHFPQLAANFLPARSRSYSQEKQEEPENQKNIVATSSKDRNFLQT